MQSQSSGEEAETFSNEATSGSSDAGTSELTPAQSRSRSSEHGRQRPRKPKRLLKDLPSAPTENRDSAGSSRGMPSRGSSSFRGLTPPPLPSAMLPSKKRHLDEVLCDKSPPEKDKMSVEIERIASGSSSEPYVLQGGPSGTQNEVHICSHRQKETKTSAELSAPRTMTSATISDQGGNNLPRRRSSRIRDTFHRGE
ncbi:hypothetical protein GGR50DRAFT_693020 [Xylaria sp. CBS 124048]|nr:hypothetical protein GGR50DRAFT_693020 [Xylaria sp. CBS 124048]